MDVISGILNALKELSVRISRLEAQGRPHWIDLTTPLTSASYDGNDTINVGTVTIDTSAVFSAPAAIKAVNVQVACNWAAASGASTLALRVAGGATNVAKVVALTVDNQNMTVRCPCDASGDFDVVVAGANALNVTIRIWGYQV